MSKEPIEGLDEDVAAEKERVLSGGASRDLIRIENLTKVSLSEVAEFNYHVWICKRVYNFPQRHIGHLNTTQSLQMALKLLKRLRETYVSERPSKVIA